MYQPQAHPVELESAVSNPSRRTLMIAWVAFVFGPIVVLIVIAHPLVGIGLLSGTVIAGLASGGRRFRRRPRGREASRWSTGATPPGGASGDGAGSGHAGERP